MTAFSSGTASSGAPAGVLENLAGLNDLALLGILASLPLSSERRAAACEVLVGRYRGLVMSCVQRYRRSPEATEDLIQVGYIGLVKAINNFDPSFGRGLAGYAQSYIIGEIKRHFRDKCWQINMKRSVRDLALQVRKTTWQLSQELGRTPTEADLVRYLGVSASELRDARLADRAFWTLSLDGPTYRPTGASLADLLGEDDPRIDHMVSMLAVARHWGELPVREQQILAMLFYGGMTQVQVGQQLGISHARWSTRRARSRDRCAGS